MSPMATGHAALSLQASTLDLARDLVVRLGSTPRTLHQLNRALSEQKARWQSPVTFGVHRHAALERAAAGGGQVAAAQPGRPHVATPHSGGARHPHSNKA